MVGFLRLDHEISDKIRGLLFDIERGAYHDGFGIRTVVYMKGCPLHCMWCANPEGQKSSPEAAFYEERCDGCGRCVEVCPEKALSSTSDKIQLDRDRCSFCSKCVDVCPHEALKIIGRAYTPKEILNEVLKDIVFYHESGGGVTLSGGEPLAQPDFSEALLKACKGVGLQTAIETCGYADWQSFEMLLKCCDVVLYDFKCIDPEKHKNFTGVSNKRILENALKVSEKGVPIIARVVLIPGLNDSKEDFLDLLRFLRRLKNIVRVDLLPYHKLGIVKYKRLGLKYALTDMEPPDELQVAEYRKLVESFGFKSSVGG